MTNLIDAFAEVLNVHRWKSMGVSSVQCECGEVLYGDESLTQFPADEAFRRHVAVHLAASMQPGPAPRGLEGHRDGETYDPELDFDRLNRQMRLVWSFVRDGRWYTLRDLARRTEMPEASISARLRDLRKPKFGNQTVERKRVSGGQWMYRVVR